MPDTPEKLSTRCCICGGGPAGMMLGLLLARGGIPVLVLEKHADFLRDFRGDTVHPSTLEIIDDLGLMPRFEKLLQRFTQLKMQFADGMLPLADFRGLARFPWMGFAPQWDFLNLLAEEGRRYPHFKLMLSTQATGVLRREDEGDVFISGVTAKSGNVQFEIECDLVVAADGRGSTLREAAGLVPQDFGAPMDALWFRISREPSDPDDTFGVVGRGQIVAMLNRQDYWQVAFVIPKGGAKALQQKSVTNFQARVGRAIPMLAERAQQLHSWDDVKLLEVQVNRLRRWHLPGLLLIGDAAHAMSPVGGVGINLAIQDAVATANIIGPALRDGLVINEELLAQVQRRREWPTRAMQFIQLQIQKRIIKGVLQSSGDQPNAPRLLRFLTRLQAVRSIPAHIFGHGFRRETLELPPHSAMIKPATS